MLFLALMLCMPRLLKIFHFHVTFQIRFHNIYTLRLPEFNLFQKTIKKYNNQPTYVQKNKRNENVNIIWLTFIGLERGYTHF